MPRKSIPRRMLARTSNAYYLLKIMGITKGLVRCLSTDEVRIRGKPSGGESHLSLGYRTTLRASSVNGRRGRGPFHRTGGKAGGNDRREANASRIGDRRIEACVASCQNRISVGRRFVAALPQPRRKALLFGPPTGTEHLDLTGFVRWGFCEIPQKIPRTIYPCAGVAQPQPNVRRLREKSQGGRAIVGRSLWAGVDTIIPLRLPLHECHQCPP